MKYILKRFLTFSIIFIISITMATNVNGKENIYFDYETYLNEKFYPIREKAKQNIYVDNHQHPTMASVNTAPQILPRIQESNNNGSTNHTMASVTMMTTTPQATTPTVSTPSTTTDTQTTTSNSTGSLKSSIPVIPTEEELNRNINYKTPTKSQIIGMWKTERKYKYYDSYFTEKKSYTFYDNGNYIYEFLNADLLNPRKTVGTYDVSGSTLFTKVDGATASSSDIVISEDGNFLKIGNTLYKR